MHTSYNHFSSKENHHESVNSYESRLKASVSTHHYTQKGSSDNLHTLKLESKILEMQKKIDHQKFQIDTLTLETETFMALCEEQKKQLSSLNIQMLKQEYEQQIGELIEEKQKLSDLIQTLSEEYRVAQSEQEERVREMKGTNLQLAKRIEASMNKKEALLQQIANSDKIHKENETILSQQEERMDSLRNIERKLFIALREMETLSKGK